MCPSVLSNLLHFNNVVHTCGRAVLSFRSLLFGLLELVKFAFEWFRLLQSRRHLSRSWLGSEVTGVHQEAPLRRCHPGPVLYQRVNSKSRQRVLLARGGFRLLLGGRSARGGWGRWVGGGVWSCPSEGRLHVCFQEVCWPQMHAG